MAHKQPQKSSNAGAIVGGIIGVAAAATAGAYFLYGTKKGKHARQQIKGWSVKAKGEILEKIEVLKDVNEEAYHKVVDAVLKRYESLKHIDSREVVQISKELKEHWKNIQKELHHGVRKMSQVKNSLVSKAKKVTKTTKAKPKTKSATVKKDE
ncbi:MAG: hypothetical protein RL094_673 [Candidatus Parcubacteria bacterium]|jgi:gas vesicle protein